MVKDTLYFSHDCNARNDPKVLAMRSRFKSEGYGWYWILVETLREQSGYKLKYVDYVFDALAMQMQCNAVKVKTFVDICIKEFELFASDGNFFWSESLLKRMDRMEEKSEKRRKAAKIRWKKGQNDASAMQSNANAEQCSASAMQNDAKEKKRKEKKRKEIKEKDISKLTPLALLWNEKCLSLSKVCEISDSWRKKEKLRLKERSLKEWELVFEGIEGSQFCKGENDSGWKATYDWIIKNQENGIKVLSGKYNGRKSVNKKVEGEDKKWERGREKMEELRSSGAEATE